MSNIVAIVGRPNVGKSTFFNRLTGARFAIVDEQSGVTRDRHYGKTDWCGQEFSVIDTGGYVVNSDDTFEKEIQKQVLIALEEADAVMFLVDVETGMTDSDLMVADILRKSKKPVFCVVNKVDDANRQLDATEFYSLGLGDIYPISAINGSGTGDLLDSVVKTFVKSPGSHIEADLPRFSVVGRPNVGKSSLINALIGEDRNIVTDISGTTRDSINTRYNKFGMDFYLVDTAGIRKKSKVHEDVEFYSVMRSVRAIENSDVCIMMLDATLGLEAQDMSIISVIKKNSKGIVILVNKWDLIEKETKTADDFKKDIQEKLAPFNDVPIIFISALTKQRIFKSLETAVEVYENRKQKLTTSSLNDYLLDAIQAYPPPAVKGKYIKIKYVTQLPSHAPAFAFYCNLPQYVKEPYKRYLENKIRDRFDFTGVPIKIFMRKK